MGSEGFRHVETKSNAVLFYSAEENQVNTPAYNARAAFSATGTSTALTARKAYFRRKQVTENQKLLACEETRTYAIYHMLRPS